jgi:hypothetical protein
VRVRVKPDYLKTMTVAAKSNKKTLSTWIRSSLKTALQKGGFMTTYEQQIASGKEIVRGILANLANELHEPKVNDLSFTVTDQDFDYDRISLVDPKLKILAKLEEDDLADCLTTKTVRKKLEIQLRQAVQAFYGPK